MKKIFTLIAVAACTLAANAQYTEFDTSSLSDVAAGTVMGTSSNGIVAKTGFADQCKIVGVSASGYTTINIAGTDYSVAGGYQGNNNAKDADGGNPANTGLVAASGSVLVLDVPASVEAGYIYVVGKFSQNKQYVVTEDGAGFIGYTVICDGTAAGKAGEALTAELKGDDADQYYHTTFPIDKLGDLNGAGSSAANNGVGIIKFAVYGGSSYAVHATGSKLTQCGFYFSASGDETITLSGTDVPEITLQGTTAVEAVAEAKAEVAAPVKVITANGVQIGNFNIAGQQVK